MELTEVLRRRRMVRHFLDDPLDPAAVERILAAGLRAPSAGFSQGYGLLVLDAAADRERFWQLTTVDPATASWPEATRLAVRRAPLVVVTLSCKAAYLDRYARPDKGWSDRDESRWTAPYWHVDTGMVALLMLLQAIDEGLGALFMGMDPAVVPAFRAGFDVPADHDVVGVVLVGNEDPQAPHRDLAARRRPAADVVHHGRW